MTGQSWLPPHRDLHGLRCNVQQAGQVPKRAGEYIRRCRYCRQVFIAVVSVAARTSARCGTEVLHLRWLDGDREPVA